ncbi:hypothetical protein [Methylophilus sp. 5]|uniref:hypothetical protein n=1 Tax=Methylophilus sp. 5 TaxID=1112274 RepID=UPI0004BB6CEE|nr:hypothetical protein [Methylophilus sp. 5]
MKPSKSLTTIGLLWIVISTSIYAQDVTIQPPTSVENSAISDAVPPPRLTPQATNDIPAASVQIEKIKIIYSQYSPSGSVLKNELDEVRIIKPSNTGKELLKQVGLNVLLLPLGVVGFSGFGKTDLQGDKIDENTLQNRTNLVNPIATKYIQTVSSSINEAIAKDTVLSTQTFKKPLIVSNGLTRLIYENLQDSSEKPAQYRLYTQLIVYKPGEGWFFGGAPNQVDCSQISQQLFTQAQWAEDDYRQVKQAFDKVLIECQVKVVAELRALLAN